jgi:hypothetical protein
MRAPQSQEQYDESEDTRRSSNDHCCNSIRRVRLRRSGARVFWERRLEQPFFDLLGGLQSRGSELVPSLSLLGVELSDVVAQWPRRATPNSFTKAARSNKD